MPSITPFPRPRLFAVTPEGDDVPDFSPWKPVRLRANGWSTHDQRLFIHELTRCGSVGMAAKSVGKSPRSAYALREKWGAESFAAAWMRAVRIGVNKIRTCLRDRFIHGELRPRFYHGRVIGNFRKYNDRAMVAVLDSLTRIPHEPIGHQYYEPSDPDDYRTEAWIRPGTTLDEYRTRLENWEGSLRAREFKLDWDMKAYDEQEAEWEQNFRAREWKRQERAERSAALRAEVKAQREREKERRKSAESGPRIFSFL